MTILASRERGLHARPSTPGRAADPRMGYVPALDGIRGLAVAAVIAYHAGVGWAKGGLLGVDVFFVLSGFLITSLLVDEQRRHGRISLGGFWARRARRLLPALLLLLIAVSAEALFVLPRSQLHQLRGDGLSALAYVANWHFAFSGQGYFDHFQAPSPLLHLWSLGVEEQFYLIWPIIAVLCLRRRRRSLATVAISGAAVSAVLMAVLAVAGVESSRLYYGTDTRAAPLLIGAAFAAARPVNGYVHSPKSRGTLSALGLAGAAVVIWCCLRVGGQSPALYRGGFVVLALAVALLIISVVELPRSPMSRLFSLQPLAFLGKISYALYLWHWPLFLLLDRARTGLTGNGLLAVRLLVTLAAALLSYYLIERPIRTRRLRIRIPRLIVPAAVLSVAVLLAASTANATTAQTELAAGGAPTTAPPPPRKAIGPKRPVRVLVTGDSVAFTLAKGMLPLQKQEGIQLYNGGTLGCGIARLLPVIDDDIVSDSSPAWCAHWDVTRAAMVAKFDPDVSFLLVGRWEVLDRQLNGRWAHLGEPDFDAYILTEIRRSIAVLGVGGRPVVLATAPTYLGRERANGESYPQDDPARVAAFNRLIREAAAERPQQVTVFDLNGLLTPGNKYSPQIAGVTVRPDGIHLTAAGAVLTAQTLAPELVRLGAQRRNADATSKAAETH